MIRRPDAVRREAERRNRRCPVDTYGERLRRLGVADVVGREVAHAGHAFARERQRCARSIHRRRRAVADGVGDRAHAATAGVVARGKRDRHVAAVPAGRIRSGRGRGDAGRGHRVSHYYEGCRGAVVGLVELADRVVRIEDHLDVVVAGGRGPLGAYGGARAGGELREGLLVDRRPVDEEADFHAGRAVGRCVSHLRAERRRIALEERSPADGQSAGDQIGRQHLELFRVLADVAVGVFRWEPAGGHQLLQMALDLLQVCRLAKGTVQ